MAKQKQPKYWLFLSATSLKTLLSQARDEAAAKLGTKARPVPKKTSANEV